MRHSSSSAKVSISTYINFVIRQLFFWEKKRICLNICWQATMTYEDGQLKGVQNPCEGNNSKSVTSCRFINSEGEMEAVSGMVVFNTYLHECLYFFKFLYELLLHNLQIHIQEIISFWDYLTIFYRTLTLFLMHKSKSKIS